MFLLLVLPRRLRYGKVIHRVLMLILLLTSFHFILQLTALTHLQTPPRGISYNSWCSLRKLIRKEGSVVSSEMPY